MKKGILNKISMILDPFVHLAEVGASKAKEWRNDVVEDTIYHHSKKDQKISKEMIEEYIDHSKRMDDLMDQLFQR